MSSARPLVIPDEKNSLRSCLRYGAFRMRVKQRRVVFLTALVNDAQRFGARSKPRPRSTTGQLIVFCSAFLSFRADGPSIRPDTRFAPLRVVHLTPGLRSTLGPRAPVEDLASG